MYLVSTPFPRVILIVPLASEAGSVILVVAGVL